MPRNSDAFTLSCKSKGESKKFHYVKPDGLEAAAAGPHFAARIGKGCVTANLDTRKANERCR